MDSQLAAKPRSTLFHPPQTKPAPLRDGCGIESDPVVGNLQDDCVVDLVEADEKVVGMGMAEDVVQGLLGDAVEPFFNVQRQPANAVTPEFCLYSNPTLDPFQASL